MYGDFHPHEIDAHLSVIADSLFPSGAWVQFTDLSPEERNMVDLLVEEGKAIEGTVVENGIPHKVWSLNDAIRL